MDSLLNSIFDDFWSSLAFFVIFNLIVGWVIDAIKRRRRDTLIKQDYKKMEIRRERD